MKKFAVLTLLVLAPLALLAQTQHLKFTQNGEFASLNGSTGPNNSFSLQVARSSGTAGTTATISYVEFDVAADLNSINIVQIIGAIPGSAFTGQNTQHLRLNFDTSQLDPSTSFSQSCVFDLINFTLTCGPGPQGQIQLDFQENGTQRSQTLALEQVSTTGPVTVRTHQKSDNGSANAQGTIFGTPVSSPGATVGVNHSSTLEMITN